MSHPSNEDLLDLVLGADGAASDLERHIRECPGCSVRLAEVRQEQELLRETFTRVPAPEGLGRGAPGRPRAWILGAAAAGLLALAAGAVAFRAAVAPSGRLDKRRSPIAVERLHRKLYAVVQRLEDAQEALTRPGDERVKKNYVELLSEEERLLAESLEGSLDLVAPISPLQSGQLRAALHEFNAQAWEHPDAARLAAQFKERLRSILNKEQYDAFLEYSVAEMEWDRENDIDHFTTDLARHFDLRYSESRRVRDTLEAQCPSEELPLVCPTLDVTDRLLESPPLTMAVRNALDPEHRNPLDTYLEGVRKTRIEAARIARQYSGGR